MKVWKKFGLLIVAITVMTGTYLLNTTEVYAIGPNDSGVPQVGDSVGFLDDAGTAILTNRVAFTIKPTPENGWDNALIVYLYKYTSNNPTYPRNAELDGSLLYKLVGSGFFVNTSYANKHNLISDLKEKSVTEIEERHMTCQIMEWDTGSGPDAPTPCSTTETETPVIIDHDTFKSEMPSKTVIVSNTLGAKSLSDLKVHAADDKTKANQAFLVQNYIGANAKILLTENIYPRRDLSTIENGSLQTLTWGNLPKNQPGSVYAVVYNQTDKAYVISGTLDANGTATFTGFKLRPASTITICK